MHDILQYAKKICRADLRGGRSIISSDCAGVLYDCPAWDDAYSEALICRYPECKISIREAQETSTSGFAVFFHIENRPLVWVWAKKSYLVLLVWLVMNLGHVLHTIRKP
jgi:hypothetical protein